MEKSLNKVELKGNVGQEPKIVKLEGGATVVRFSLATHENYKNREGEWKEETVWHNIVAWSSKYMPDLGDVRGSHRETPLWKVYESVRGGEEYNRNSGS